MGVVRQDHLGRGRAWQEVCLEDGWCVVESRACANTPSSKRELTEKVISAREGWNAEAATLRGCQEEVRREKADIEEREREVQRREDAATAKEAEIGQRLADLEQYQAVVEKREAAVKEREEAVQEREDKA